MRLLLNVILIFITVLACFIEDIYLNFKPPQSEQLIYLTIRSRRNFNFDQQKALDDKRKNALSQYEPVYRFSMKGVEASIKQFEAFKNAVTSFQETRQGGVENLRNQLQKEFGVQLSPANVIRILNYRDLNNLLDGIVTIEESILKNKIIDDFRDLKGKETILVKYILWIRIISWI